MENTSTYIFYKEDQFFKKEDQFFKRRTNFPKEGLSKRTTLFTKMRTNEDKKNLQSLILSKNLHSENKLPIVPGRARRVSMGLQPRSNQIIL